LRQDRAQPILDDLETWLGTQLPKISGKSELAKAIRYALARMKKLKPYLGHGFLELDNNSAERAIKPIALGRKNYLFVGSVGGGPNSTASIRKPGSPTSSPASPITRSHASTSSFPGVTLRPERNRHTPNCARAPTPDGHRASPS
jgi:hypothetical protein